MRPREAHHHGERTLGAMILNEVYGFSADETVHGVFPIKPVYDRALVLYVFIVLAAMEFA